MIVRAAPALRGGNGRSGTGLLIVFLCFLFGEMPLHAAPIVWRAVAPGLDYTKIAAGAGPSPGWVHAFRLDAAHYRIDCFLARDFGTKTAMVRDMAKKSNAVLAINGGFFSTEFEPLGLRIQAGKQRNPVKTVSWWDIFFLQNNIPHFTAARGFTPLTGTQMAIQSGPRLVVNDTIPRLKGGTAERSAIGGTRDGHIIVAVTEHAPMETRALAELFWKPNTEGGFDCPNALNLDGGGSSQLSARMRGFLLDVAGFSPVTDALVVLPK